LLWLSSWSSSHEKRRQVRRNFLQLPFLSACFWVLCSHKSGWFWFLCAYGSMTLPHFWWPSWNFFSSSSTKGNKIIIIIIASPDTNENKWARDDMWNELDLKCPQKPTKQIDIDGGLLPDTVSNKKTITRVTQDDYGWCQRKWICDGSAEVRSRESENDVEVWNRLRRKWLLEEMSFKFWVKLKYGLSKKGSSRVELVSLRKWPKGWRSSFVPKNRCVISEWSVAYFESREAHGACESNSRPIADERVCVSDWTCWRLWR